MVELFLSPWWTPLMMVVAMAASIWSIQAVGIIKSYYKQELKIVKEQNKIIEGWLQECRQNRIDLINANFNLKMEVKKLEIQLRDQAIPSKGRDDTDKLRHCTQESGE